jgi:hypothetical protein
MSKFTGRCGALLAIAVISGGVVHGADPGAAASGTPAAVPAPLTPPQMRADLVYLRDEIGSKDKSFDARGRRQFEAIICEAIDHVDSLTAPQFGLTVARALAASHNSHTAAPPYSLFHALPLRFAWFSDGLYVVKAHPDFANLIGVRVEKFGSLSAEQVLQRLSPYLSGRPEWQRASSPLWLMFLEPLYAIGASSSQEEATLTFRMKDGTAQTLMLHAAPSRDPTKNYGLWSPFIPDAQTLPGRWPHALDGLAAVPLAYQPPVDIAGQMIGGDQRILYIRSNLVDSIGSGSFDQHLAAVQQIILKEHPQNIVVDLRFNEGGDFFNTLLMSEALPNLVPQKGRVFVLVDGVTHSAAIVTAARLRYFGAGRTLFVGTPMADHGDFWAEGGNERLPNSRISVSYASQFEDWARGCTDLDKCYWASVAFGVRNVSLAPDIRVEPTFADYVAGRDPLLEAALLRAR